MSEIEDLYFPELNFSLHDRVAAKCYCKEVSAYSDCEFMDLNRFPDALTRLENISQIDNSLNLNGIGELSSSQLKNIIADINQSKFKLKTVSGNAGAKFDTVSVLDDVIDSGIKFRLKIPGSNINDSIISDLLREIELPPAEVSANHEDKFNISQNIILEIVLSPGIEDKLDDIFQIANNHNIYKINYSLDYSVFSDVKGFEDYLEVFKSQFKSTINKLVNMSLEYEAYLQNLSSFPACAFDLKQLFLMNDFTKNFVGRCCPQGHVDPEFNLSFCGLLGDKFDTLNIMDEKIENKLTTFFHKIADKRSKVPESCMGCGYKKQGMCTGGCIYYR